MKRIVILISLLIFSIISFARVEIKGDSFILSDRTGKSASNSVFGDAIVATKHDVIGCQFQYNITTYDAISTTTTNSTITATSSQAILSTGTSSDILDSAKLQSKAYLRYRPAKEGYFYFTAAFTTSPGSVKVGTSSSIQYIGLWDDSDGFYIGFKNKDFIVGKRRNGTDETVRRENFNRNALDGTGEEPFNIDFTKLNIFRISYGWLGAAPITFEVCSPKGKWIPFHVWEYPNTEVLPHTYNPVLPIRAYVAKTATGNAIDVVLRTSSWSAGVVNGESLEAGNRYFSVTTSKSITANTVTNLLTLKNNATFQGLTNKVMITPIMLSCATEGTKSVRFAIRKNATVEGTPTFAAIRSDASVCSVDYAGTTVTGGEILDYVFLQKADAQTIYTENFSVYIYPGETLTISALSTANSDVDCVLRWEEQF